MTDEHTGAEYLQQKLVLGTTARSEDEIALNGIIIMNVRFPTTETDRFATMDEKNPEFRPSVGLFTSSANMMTIHGILPQSFPLTNVRVMPQKTELVCAKLADSSVVIYDWKTELRNGWSFDDPVEERPPMLELAGHDTNLPSSHGLAWNPTQPKAGLIASCGKDGRILVSRESWVLLVDWLIDWLIDWLTDELIDWLIHWLIDWLMNWLIHWLIHWLIDWLIDWLIGWLIKFISIMFQVWDISGARRRTDVKPYLTFTGHETEVQDVAWHPLYPTLLGSAGLDKCFCLFDIRSKNTSKPSHRVEAHDSSVNAISFALSETVLATGSDDGTVAVWDMRNLGSKLHSLRHHVGDVFTLDWCHDVERAPLLVSGGADRRICLWDVSRINDKPEPDGPATPPELLFVHGGHSGRVTDVTWNPASGRKLMIASVAEDSVIQVQIRLIDWLIYWLADCLIDWFTVRLIDWLIDRVGFWCFFFQVWTPVRNQIWPLDHRDPAMKKAADEVAAPIKSEESTETDGKKFVDDSAAVPEPAPVTWEKSALCLAVALLFYSCIGSRRNKQKTRRILFFQIRFLSLKIFRRSGYSSTFFCLLFCLE